MPSVYRRGLIERISSVVLQTFTVGAELALVNSSRPNIPAVVWVILVRFVIMPGIGLLFVWGTDGRGLYVDDKLMWYAWLRCEQPPRKERDC